jgi:membrane protease YdiL (CAAX protease family)
MAWIVPLSLVLVSSLFAGPPGTPPNPQPLGIPTEDGLTLQAAITLGAHLAAVGILLLLWWRGVLRPASLRRGTRDVEGLPGVAWFAAAGLLFMAPAVGGSAALALPARVLGPTDGVRHDGMVALAAYGLTAVAIAVMVYLLVPRAPGAGLRPRVSDAPRGLLAFALTLPVVVSVGAVATALSFLLTGTHPDAIAHSTLHQILNQRTDPWVYAVILGAVVGAPVAEEYTYRIFLQSGLARVLRDRLLAIMLASAVFALVHRIGPSPVPWHAVAAIFTLGLGCGIAYERTGRPGVPVVIHALFNAFNVALAMVAQ